jgi:superfamily I DNA/RNA helicase
MPQVALSSDFLKAFANIPPKKQKTVREALEKFKRDPTSLAQNYEKIHDVEDDKVRTVRCGIDYRAIVIAPPKGDVYLFAWVDHHDEAMAWARRKRFEVNQHTGTFQVYEVKTASAADDAPQAAAEARVVSSVESEVIPTGRLFSGHDNTTLLLFGVPEPLLVAVRALREEADLDGLARYLPQEAADALYLLAAGYSPEDTIEELDRTKPVEPKPEFDPNDFEAAMARPGTQQTFKVVEDDHELAEILNSPLALWRIFLHPSQAKLVKMHSNGPARVLGGAGTGKTVVAMHRARHLARSCAVGKKILFTTYTTNLAADIQGLLASLCGQELEQIEVTNLHAWARGVLQARGIKVRTTQEQPDKGKEGWDDACALDVNNRFVQSFYEAEWAEVVQAQGILDKAAYLRARRAGRGTRLSREQRGQVWEVLEGYRRFLQKNGLMDPADMIREARLLLEAGKVPQRYAAIVADEVQDFSESELCLLRAMVPESPNDLFLVGDAHQRIYGHKASLSRCGINVRGLRSRRLRLNYRTTQSIRNWGVAILRGMSVDDLDEGTDDALKGYHSLRVGSAPEVVHHATEKAEDAFIVARVRAWVEKGRAPGDICITARTNKLVEKRYAQILKDAGFSIQIIKTDESKLGDGVRLATMHRIKGLEFPCVLIAGVEAGTMPYELKSYADETARQDHLDTEKRLMFVAATRARDELVVTGFGATSEFLKG